MLRSAISVVGVLLFLSYIDDVAGKAAFHPIDDVNLVGSETQEISAYDVLGRRKRGIDTPSETNYHTDTPSQTNLHTDTPSETNHHTDTPSETNHHTDTPSETNHHTDTPSQTNHHTDTPSQTNHHTDTASQTNHHTYTLITYLTSEQCGGCHLEATSLSQKTCMLNGAVCDWVDKLWKTVKKEWQKWGKVKEAWKRAKETLQKRIES
ncbi:hypothetical protein LSAT2_033103 [Lamellibrachia satsuma]|nr:hypothetical protein LSAT2_033103 [Lamellibrachia satsuma]